jgi:hypothetical protein
MSRLLLTRRLKVDTFSAWDTEKQVSVACTVYGSVQDGGGVGIALVEEGITAVVALRAYAVGVV